MPSIEEVIEQILGEIAAEVTLLAPRIFFAITAITIIALIGKILHTYLSKLLEFANIDEGFEKIAGKAPPVSISRIIIRAIDVGLAFLGILIAARLLLPQESMDAFMESLVLLGKMASILLIALIILSLFNFLITKMKIETKLRSYLFFISFLILTALLIDISALSPEVKTSLVSGLSTGIGLSIAVFAVWFFFGDYIKEYLSKFKEKTV
ncbi:MAG: hypothetical protein DRJ38_07445 [Thermoprotei archaeon]|mgnify:CR=1 FL=1|nr:MAG: hypothetical protein DRJ38_07445 [Thermoprotei archaeon]